MSPRYVTAFVVPNGQGLDTERVLRPLGIHHHRLKTATRISSAKQKESCSRLTPDNDRHLLQMFRPPPLPNRFSRSPDVQIQTVFGLWVLVLELWHKRPKDATTRQIRRAAACLHTDRFVLRSGDITSMRCGLGWEEALVASGRSTVGDSEPLGHIGHFWVDETGEGAGVSSGFEMVAFVPPVSTGKVTIVITFVRPVFAKVGQD
jgi:hypothetical protein